jgi:ParB family chromosome partitioning protein
LGRGLSALLGEVDAPAPAEAATAPVEIGGLAETPIELIHRNADQPRKFFADQEIIDLSESIRAKGVLQPILVRPSPATAGSFEIVAGERRWRAAQMAGLQAMPTIVRELDDLQVLEIGIVENVQRADLNALEEAQAYKVLIERFGRKQEDIAIAVGKSRSHIANTLRLLALPETVQEHVVHGRLSPGHARAIAKADNVDALAERIVAGGLSVREAESLARKADTPKKASGPRKAAPKDTDTQALENDLAEALGLTVEISDRGGAGSVTISYESLEQLDEICRRLTRAG